MPWRTNLANFPPVFAKTNRSNITSGNVCCQQNKPVMIHSSLVVCWTLTVSCNTILGYSSMFAEDKITPNLPGTQVVHKKELIYMLQPEHMYPSKEPVYFFISGWENTCIAAVITNPLSKSSVPCCLHPQQFHGCRIWLWGFPFWIGTIKNIPLLLISLTDVKTQMQSLRFWFDK